MDCKDRNISLPYLSSLISYHLQYEYCTVNLAQSFGKELAKFFCKGVSSVLGFAGHKANCHIVKRIQRQHSSPLYPQGIHSKILSGCLKPWIAPNPTYRVGQK